VRFAVLGFRLLPAASIAKFNKPLEEATFAQLAAYSRRGYTPEVCQLGVPRSKLDLKIKQLKINEYAIR
jgi:hypothetical protein